MAREIKRSRDHILLPPWSASNQPCTYNQSFQSCLSSPFPQLVFLHLSHTNPLPWPLDTFHTFPISCRAWKSSGALHLVSKRFVDACLCCAARIHRRMWTLNFWNVCLLWGCRRYFPFLFLPFVTFAQATVVMILYYCIYSYRFGQLTSLHLLILHS